jgi:hypothetical protein
MHRSLNRLGRWADKRLPGLLLLAFLVLMSQLDSARATDIEVAPLSADEGLTVAGLSLAVLGFVSAAPLPALAALLYGLRRARRSTAARADRPVNFSAADRQPLSNTTEHRTMRLGEFPPAALAPGRAGARVLASLAR